MTLKVKILGPGCINCYRVEENTVEALERVSQEEPELEATLQHVTDFKEIMKYPILATPGLVVNEELVCAGRIPRVDEIVSWMREALDGQAK